MTSVATSLYSAIDTDNLQQLRDTWANMSPVVRERYAWMALATAARGNKLAVTRCLLEGGVNVNIHDDYGMTPLMVAAQEGNCGMMRLLLEAKARVDDCDRVGWTALFYAARAQRLEASRVLINAGADLARRDVEGRSVLMVAQRRPFGVRLPFGMFIAGVRRVRQTSDVVRFLKDVGAR